MMLWPWVVGAYGLAVALTQFFGLRLIGLTGGIATGKSTCVAMLQRKNVAVIDFDLISRLVVQPGTRTLRRLVSAFGPEILVPQTGELNRAALGTLIFSDPAKRKRLDAIMRPALLWEFARQVLSQSFLQRRRVVVVDAPLLFEAGLAPLCWEAVLVDSDDETQLKRLMERDNIGEDAARSRVEAQWSMARKRALATRILLNVGTKEDLQAKVDQWWSKVESRLANPWASMRLLLFPTPPALIVAAVALAPPFAYTLLSHLAARFLKAA